MENSFTTGNSSVDAMLTLNIQGNIIPFSWYRTILRQNGKPYLLAIIVLSDLVYWFRPVEDRDEVTGRFLGWHKRFKADLLQKSYQSYADLFGESKRSIKAAMDTLEELGVIRREFRDVQTPGGIANNVMFIDLDVDVLERLTYPDKENGERVIREEIVRGESLSCSRPEGNTGTENTLEHLEKQASEHQDLNDEILRTGGGTKFCRRVVQNSVGGSYETLGESPAKFCGTNTENTTENTSENYQSIYPGTGKAVMKTPAVDGSDEMDKPVSYQELIRNNISYEYLMQESNPSKRQMYHEIFLLICDVVCQERKTIRIGKEDLPYQMVKSRFLSFDMRHIQYVTHKIQNTESEIRNMRAYMLTTLYYAPTTMTSYWAQKAAHDLRAGVISGEHQRE